METNAVNNPPKNATLKKEECEALSGKRDVLLDYACDTPVLKLGTTQTTFLSDLSPSLCQGFQRGFCFFSLWSPEEIPLMLGQHLELSTAFSRLASEVLPSEEISKKEGMMWSCISWPQSPCLAALGALSGSSGAALPEQQENSPHCEGCSTV